MKFKSRKDILISSIIIGISFLLVGTVSFDFATTTNAKHEYWSMVIIVAVVTLLLWLYLGTNYELSNN